MACCEWELQSVQEFPEVRYWLCEGCYRTRSGEGQRPPDEECPGKRPHTAEDAALILRVSDAGHWPLPEDFWQRRGAKELLLLLDEQAPEAG